MHRLLEKQIKKYFGGEASIPPQLRPLIEAVNEAYAQADKDRLMLEHSLELTSEELVERNRQLRTDIQTREATHERNSQQSKIAGEIARVITTATDMGQLYQRTVRLIHERLGFYYVQMLRYSPASNSLVLVAGTGDVGRKMLVTGYQVPMHLGLIGRAAATLSSVLLTDVGQDPNWAPTPFLLKTKSEIAVPVVLGDQLLGVLDVQSETPNGIDTDLQLLMEVLCGQIAVAIESIRLRTEMEERLRELDALQRITTGEGWKAYRGPEEGSPVGYSFDQLAGEPRRIDYAPTQSNGDASNEENGEKSRRAFLKPMTVRGQVIGSIGIEQDPGRPFTEEERSLLDSVTLQVAEALERARLFEESKRSAAELAVLNEMGNAFTEALDVGRVLDNTYKFTAKLMELHDFIIALYDEQANVISFALTVLSGERVTENHPLWPSLQPRPLGPGLTSHIIRTRQPLLVERDAEERLREMGLDYIQIGNISLSYLGVPMVVGERVLGVISAQSDTTPGLYNQHHLELLTAVASQAAIAIDNSRLFEQEQERAEQERLVRTITDRVRRGTSRDDILRITLEELNKALGAKKSVVHLGTREQLLAPAPAGRKEKTKPRSRG